MVFRYLFQAYRGKIFQKKLERKYGKGLYPSRYILFPSDDDEYNAWGIYFLNYYIKKNKLDKVIILVKDDKVMSAIKNISHINLRVILIKKEMSSLIRLAGLVNLSDKWTIVSVKEPYDTGAERMLGKKGITKKEIVWYDVYKMSDKPDSAEIPDISKWNISEDFIAFIKNHG